MVVGIRHLRGSADGVRQVAHLRMARVACRQATYREGVVVECEG